MRVIGINISHDTSVAEVENGELKYCHDEARFRRHKYWDPDKLDFDHDKGLQCIEQNNIEEPDHLIFATFDRRNLHWNIHTPLIEDRLLAEKFASDCRQQQLTQERIDELMQEYGKHIDLDKDESGEGDMRIADLLADYHWNMQGYHIEPEHHFYHAECSYFLSPYNKDNEDAISIVWDGGGAMRYHESHPAYQEVESIYLCKPGLEPELQWQKLSNHRMVTDIGWQFPNMGYDAFTCLNDIQTEIDGVQLVFTSKPSSGMNFSQMSVALGCDEWGGAAGKVMGMASYARPVETTGIFGNFSVAQQLEEESLRDSIATIQKAVDLNPDVKNIVLSGGYSLNCTNNYKYLDAFPDHQFFVDPIPHDGGTGAGAAIWFERMLKNGTVTQETNND